MPNHGGDSPASATTTVRWRIVGLLCAISFFDYFNRISMPVAGERIMNLYPIDEVQMGWVYSSLLIAYAVFMIPGGWLSDRLGSWMTLTAMGLGTAACCFLTGLTGHPALVAAGLIWPCLLGIRAVMGTFTTPLYPAAGRVVAHWVPFRRRGLANGLVTGAAMIGIASAYPLFAALIDVASWQLAFAVTGTSTALVATTWAWYGRNDPASHRSVNRAELALIASSASAVESAGPSAGRLVDPSPAEVVEEVARPAGTWRTLARNRSLWLLTACYVTMGYVEYLVFYWSGHYFKQVLQFGEWQSQFAAMAPPLAMGVGMPLGGWMADRLMGPLGYRWGRASVALVGMVGCGTLLCAGTLVSAPMAIIVCFALSLGAIGMCEGAAWATAIDLGGPRGATSAAIANTGGNVGGFISPVVTPWVGAILTPSLGRTLGWAWGLRLGGFICLAGACLWLWIDASERASDDGVGPTVVS